MAKIYNSDVIQSLIEKAGIQTSHDLVPTQLAEKIIAVLNVNPDRQIKTILGSAIDSATQTVFTTTTTKRTFLVGVQMAIAKDAVSDAVSSSIEASPIGQGQGIIAFIRFEPSTAGQFNEFVKFPIPLELKSGTAVQVKNSTATASIDNTCVFYYYEVD